MQKALDALKQGNKRFVEGRLTHQREVRSQRDKVSDAQMPGVIVVSCSDSRVPPEVIFDQRLGSLFVIRTAGEAVDFAAVASIEYAVAHFHPKILLVLGHDYCGAVKATLTTPEGQSAGSPDLDKLVESLRPHLAGFTYQDKAMTKPVAANAAVTGTDLVTRSSIIRNAVDGKSMVLLRGVYHLKDGTVYFW